MFMEHLCNSFNAATGWNPDNFSNITSTSTHILDFPIPSSLSLEVSSQATPQSASSFTLSNKNAVNGSLSYLYSSVDLARHGTRKMDVRRDLVASGPVFPSSLLYGRMYFPGRALEAMVVKRMSRNMRLLAKCVSNPHLANNGALIVYLQRSTPRLSSEAIYSTNESLVGVRCLYTLFGGDSSASVGSELWYAASSMSPGLSTAFRYCLRATDTPLTMTLAVNPILGHISSTYSVRTSAASQFSSRYDFNFYSYNSNLTVGVELFRNKEKKQKEDKKEYEEYTEDNQELKELKEFKKFKTFKEFKGKETLLGFPNPLDSPLTSSEICGSHWESPPVSQSFSSVVKVATSTNDRRVNVLWEGRLKDFLVSTGARLAFDGYSPVLSRFGVSFSYAC